jgi:hypothetical protein
MAIDGLPGHVRRMTLRHLLRAGLCPASACRLGDLCLPDANNHSFFHIVFFHFGRCTSAQSSIGNSNAIFETAIGLWLLIKGLKQPAIK